MRPLATNLWPLLEVGTGWRGTVYIFREYFLLITFFIICILFLSISLETFTILNALDGPPSPGDHSLTSPGGWSRVEGVYVHFPTSISNYNKRWPLNSYFVSHISFDEIFSNLCCSGLSPPPPLVSPGITWRSEAVPEGPRSFFDINYITRSRSSQSEALS